MITAEEESTIEDHAYVPEHLPQYVTPISGAEPFLLDDFLAYRKKIAWFLSAILCGRLLMKNTCKGPLRGLSGVLSQKRLP